MLVGFMRNNRKPFKMVRLLAKACKYYNIDIIYFHANDVDIEKKVINGKILINNKWVTKEVPIPKFIDISPYCFKYTEVFQFLKENSLLSATKKLGSKNNVYKKIEEDGEFTNLLIPTSDFADFNDFHNFVQEYSEVILKPKDGIKGKNVYKFSLKDENYTFTYQQTEENMSYAELKEFFNNNINVNQYILQKYIDSTNKNGDPFDCRIRLEKDGKGEWKVVVYLVRIGSNQKVVSNVSQGGSVSKLLPFLQANFGDKTNYIHKNIKKTAKKLPPKVEKIFHRSFNALGLDIGIDKNGDLFLFEVETGPGTDFGMGEIATIKADYYNYIRNELQKS